jgi:hypothetical protein
MSSRLRLIGFSLGIVSVALGVLTQVATARVQPAGCPARALARVPTNAWVAARGELAPAGAVALRLCRYGGLNGSAPLALARSWLVTAPAIVGRLAREFDALPAYPKGAIFHCPAEDGSQVLALFAYPSGERVVLALQLTGCRVVTNGDLQSLADGYANTPNGPRLVTELKTLTAIAHVHGLIRVCGGPAPSRCLTQDATVSVHDAAGRTIATERTHDARFFFSLPPAPYTLIARTGGTSGTRSVTLAAGRTVTANITIAIP